MKPWQSRIVKFAVCLLIIDLFFSTFFIIVNVLHPQAGESTSTDFPELAVLAFLPRSYLVYLMIFFIVLYTMVGGFAITVIVVYFNVSFNMKLRCKKENEEQRNIVDSDA